MWSSLRKIQLALILFWSVALLDGRISAKELCAPDGSAKDIESFLSEILSAQPVSFALKEKAANDFQGWWLEPEQKDTFNGFPLTLHSSLPPGAVYYGKDKDRFLIPVTKKPEDLMQEGDILIFFTPEFAIRRSHREWEQNGHWHVAIVGRDEQGLIKVQIPAKMASRNFEEGLYHILRPVGSPDLKRQVNDFIVEMIKKGKMKSVPTSPFEVLTIQDKEDFKKNLLSGAVCWETSCAELAVTAFELND